MISNGTQFSVPTPGCQVCNNPDDFKFLFTNYGAPAPLRRCFEVPELPEQTDDIHPYVKNCELFFIYDFEVCEKCKEGFIPNESKSACLKPKYQLDHCVLALATEILENAACAKCEDGYWLDETNVCRKNTLKHCVVWGEETEFETCSVCESDYKPEFKGYGCVKI